MLGWVFDGSFHFFVFTIFFILGYIVFNSKCLCVGGLYTKSHYFFPGATSPAEWCRCNCPSPDKRTRKLMKSDQLKSKLVWKYLGITSFNILPTGAAWQQDSFIEVWLSLWAPIDCYCQQKAVCYCYKSLNTLYLAQHLIINQIILIIQPFSLKKARNTY